MRRLRTKITPLKTLTLPYLHDPLPDLPQLFYPRPTAIASINLSLSFDSTVAISFYLPILGPTALATFNLQLSSTHSSIPPLYLPQPLSLRPYCPISLNLPILEPTALSATTYLSLTFRVLYYSVPDLTALYSRPDRHTELYYLATNFHGLYYWSCMPMR